MKSIIMCLSSYHDRRLLLAAGAVCLIGVYASFALSKHAVRCAGEARRRWAAISMVSAASTAWATHMIALLAYEPGMEAGFDPILTAFSLLIAILGICSSMLLAIGDKRPKARFVAGLALGLAISGLHYVGQLAYRVTGSVSWDWALVVCSIGIALALFGTAMVVAAHRVRSCRKLAAPLLFTAIAVLHIGGMSAMTLTFDPRITLPSWTVAPDIISPVLAGVSLSLITLAMLGLRLTLSAQAQFRRDQAKLNELANLAVEGLAICEGTQILTVNRSLMRLTGFDIAELSSRSIRDLVPAVEPSEMLEQNEYEANLIVKSGKIVPTRLLRREVRVGSNLLTVFAFRDQRERLASEATIRQLAYTDHLTGLLNRSRFNELMAVRIAATPSDEQRSALLAIDLDKFKWVNDTYGHSAGDALLIEIAERLRKCLGFGDIAARFGGDEFMIFTDRGAGASMSIATNILEGLSAPFKMNGVSIEIGASIGAALTSGEENDCQSLTMQADLALYAAKNEGGNRYRQFVSQMMVDTLARRQLEQDLRRALTCDEFEVYYQPQVNSESGELQGAEALVRWHHPDHGLVSPVKFIPLAEETGLISALSEKVLRMACTEAARWCEDLTLAVNLSAVQLSDPDLINNVRGILRETGYPADRLELEVTESALLKDDFRTSENLRGFKELGICLSLDDFGTGYSSLSHLKRFPFDKIKIDKSFVEQIPGNAESSAIVEAMIVLAHKLGMKVTLEGVEEAAQQKFAVRERSDQIQGF